MNIDSLKAMLFPLLTNNETQQENVKENDTETNSDLSIFSNSQDYDDLEKTILDIFTSCDKNGNGEIDDDEISALSSNLSLITGLTQSSISALISENADNGINEITEEFAQMSEPNPLQIDFTKEPTTADIQNYENLLTEFINNDELISSELKNERTETYSRIAELQAKIQQLEDKIDLSDEEKLELAKLSTEASELSEKLKENETAILENCSAETKQAIYDLNKLKELFTLAEGAGKGPVQVETIDTSAQADTNQNVIDTPAQTGTVSGSQTGTPSVGGNGGTYNPQSYDNSGNQKDSSSASYSNMSLEKLKSELSTEQSSLNDNKEELNSILNGSNETLAAIKGDIDTKREELNNLLEDVSPELAQALSDVQTRKDNKQSEIDDKKIEISEKESTVQECQRNFDNAKSAVSNQESIISNLESALSSASGENKTELEAALASAKEELKTFKSQRDDAEKNLRTEKENLATLKSDLTALETDLAGIQTEEDAVNTQIDELNNEEITAAKDELQKAEQNYEKTKSDLEAAANDKISQSESTITEIEAAITEKANSAQKSKYSTSTMDGKYTLNGVEYDTLIDGSNLKNLSDQIRSGGAGTGFGHPDECLSFAYSYGQWIDNSTNTPKNGTAGDYPDASAYTVKTGSKDSILATIKQELDDGNPVVLQVNGNKEGTRRHYVTVVGYRSDSGSTLEERDLLIIDTYDGLIEGMGDNGTRFMITGEACNKDYSGYQVYVRK